MLHDFLQVSTLSIVFVGEFNPAIVQPFWLASKQLIRESEAQNAKVELIHNEISKLDLDWLQLEVTKQRFELRTSKEPYFEATKDLAVSIFQILRETPITSLGINHIKNFALRDEKTYLEFGDRLAPLRNWSDSFHYPRLFQLEIVDMKRKDQLDGIFRVRVSPTEPILGIKFGVAFNLNDHFSVQAGLTGRNGEMLKILSEQWDAATGRAFDVIESVWSKING